MTTSTKLATDAIATSKAALAAAENAIMKEGTAIIGSKFATSGKLWIALLGLVGLVLMWHYAVDVTLIIVAACFVAFWLLLHYVDGYIVNIMNGRIEEARALAGRDDGPAPFPAVQPPPIHLHIAGDATMTSAPVKVATPPAQGAAPGVLPPPV